jgi:hypothetical protein
LFLYDGLLNDSPPTPARFFTISKTLLFNMNAEKSTASRVISHEFTHADHFHLKDDKNSACHVSSHKALSPVYPLTREEIKVHECDLSWCGSSKKSERNIYKKITELNVNSERIEIVSTV